MSDKPDKRSRLTASDWRAAALEVIAEDGVGAVAVEPLARRLNVTKGSFYWHFRNRNALLVETLEAWEKQDEAQVLARIEPIADPRKRLRAVFGFVAREMPSHRVYVALLRALDQPAVMTVMARVSQRRMNLLTNAFREAGMTTPLARQRARLTYAAYIGFMQINMTLGMPRLSHEEFDAYVDHMTDTLVP